MKDSVKSVTLIKIWCFIPLICLSLSHYDFVPQSDDKMNEIMTLAHAFLQNFCRGNTQNQILLHKHFNLFLTPGVCSRSHPTRNLTLTQ